MREYIDYLIYESLSRLLSGEMSLLKFRKEFYLLYLEIIPTEFLSNDEFSLFSEIDVVLERAVRLDETMSIALIRNLAQNFFGGNNGCHS
jgi:hypothetical protein